VGGAFAVDVALAAALNQDSFIAPSNKIFDSFHVRDRDFPQGLFPTTLTTEGRVDYFLEQAAFVNMTSAAQACRWTVPGSVKSWWVQPQGVVPVPCWSACAHENAGGGLLRSPHLSLLATYRVAALHSPR
jgi:hypothetical protein